MPAGEGPPPYDVPAGWWYRCVVSWLMRGRSWRQRESGSSGWRPGWRRGSRNSSKPPRQRGLGQATAAEALADTWTWDGTTWTEQHQATSPPRYLASMAYDAAAGAVVLFSGINGAFRVNPFGDTWTWG